MPNRCMTKVQKWPNWLKTTLPWRAVRLELPIAYSDDIPICGVVVHQNGKFGWNRGDWVKRRGRKWHYHWGLDVVGSVMELQRLHRLDDRIVCVSPQFGIVDEVGLDQHDHICVVLSHSASDSGRRRFSFFGDLEEAKVSRGQWLRPGQTLGTPMKLAEGNRFFHFGVGYEVGLKDSEYDVYVNAQSFLNGQVVFRGQRWVRGRGIRSRKRPHASSDQLSSSATRSSKSAIMEAAQRKEFRQRDSQDSLPAGQASSTCLSQLIPW